jgi:thioredoxin-like negative regulator of GroEL
MNKQLLKESIQRKEKSIFFFYTEWCEHCTKIKPTINEILKSKPGYKLIEVDNDEEDTEFLSELFEVQFLPAVVILSETGYTRHEGSMKIKKLL